MSTRQLAFLLISCTVAVAALRATPAARPSTRTRPVGLSGLTRRAATLLRCCAAEQADSGALLPVPDDLRDDELLKIVLQETPDQEVNDLVWKYLGYRLDEQSSKWDTSAVFPNWAKKYPLPPDLVGVTRTYSREVDEPVLRAVQSLQKSVPTEHKDNLRQTLRPLGWSGFKLDGLTPNKTRRAQVAQWLIYYRLELHGVPVEELKRRKDVRRARESQEATQRPTGTTKQSVI